MFVWAKVVTRHMFSPCLKATYKKPTVFIACTSVCTNMPDATVQYKHSRSHLCTARVLFSDCWGCCCTLLLQRFYDGNLDFQRFRRSMGAGMMTWSPGSVVTPAGIFCTALSLAGEACCTAMGMFHDRKAAQKNAMAWFGRCCC